MIVGHVTQTHGPATPMHEASVHADAFVLRPGVMMPDWSLVADPTAREALAASMAVAGRAQKWSGLTTAEDRVWQTILLGFARSGQAPDLVQLSDATGRDGTVIASVLHALRTRDLVVLDAEGVTAAYPFCSWVTGHRVLLEEWAAVHSLCAIDALGAGAMLRRDTIIESTCRGCGAPVRIGTHGRGRALGRVTPDAAVVWSGIKYADGCAATSGCTAKAFFCSDEHLTAWRERSDPDGVGFRLPMEAALQVGMALFVPMLAMPPAQVDAGRP